MSVNKAILIGNLGRDPELKYTQSGKAVATFTIATTERWTGQDGQKHEDTTWHNIVAWGRQGEVLNEYMRKGRQIYIEGRIVNRSYDDKDGNKKYISEIVVQNFSFIGNRADAGAGAGSASGSKPPEPAPSTSGPEGTPGGDDDLPF